MLISLSCCVKAAMGGPQGLYATHPAVWRRLTWLRAPVLDTLVLQWKRMLVLWKSVMHFWSTLASSHAWLVMPWQLSATYNLHGSRCYNSKATGGNVDSLGKRMNTGRGVGGHNTLYHTQRVFLFFLQGNSQEYWKFQIAFAWRNGQVISWDPYIKGSESCLLRVFWKS